MLNSWIRGMYGWMLVNSDCLLNLIRSLSLPRTFRRSSVLLVEGIWLPIALILCRRPLITGELPWVGFSNLMSLYCVLVALVAFSTAWFQLYWMHINYADSLCADPPQRFFKKNWDIEDWKKKKYIYSSLGGPQDSFGNLWGSLGSCGSPEGSGAVLGRAGGGSQGGSVGVLRGPLKNVMFSFCRGTFVNCLMKYWCFQFLVILRGGRWSLRYAIFNCFWKLASCDTVRWICHTSQSFLNDDAEYMISGSEFWRPG